jgi:peptidyl-dipeptidase Dcp
MTAATNHNPLLSDWNTPHAMPPFEDIETGHFLPAFEQAFAEHLQEIDAITGRAEPPTFANTIEALEQSGNLLTRVASVFFTLTSAHASDELRAVESDIAPRVAAHRSAIYTRADLYQRVKTAFEGDQSALSAEQQQ